MSNQDVYVVPIKGNTSCAWVLAYKIFIIYWQSITHTVHVLSGKQSSRLFSFCIFKVVNRSLRLQFHINLHLGNQTKLTRIHFNVQLVIFMSVAVQYFLVRTQADDKYKGHVCYTKIRTYLWTKNRVLTKLQIRTYLLAYS